MRNLLRLNNMTTLSPIEQLMNEMTARWDNAFDFSPAFCGLDNKEKWPKYTIPLDSPQIQRNVLSRFTKIPSSFWEWIKTIPWYDSTILYTMTFNKDLLQ